MKPFSETLRVANAMRQSRGLRGDRLGFLFSITIGVAGLGLQRPIKPTGKPWTGSPRSDGVEQNQEDPQCLLLELPQVVSILFPA